MKKRLLSLFLTAILAVPLMSACAVTENTPEMSRVSNVYKAEAVELPDSYNVVGMTSFDGRVILECTEDLTDPTTGEGRNIRRVLVELDPSTGEFSETALPEFDFEKRQIYGLCYSPDGSIVMSTVHLDYESESYYYDVVRYDNGEMTVLCDDLEPLFETDTTGNRYATDFYLNKLLTDGEGNIYVVTETLIGVFDSMMNKLFELSFDRYIEDIGIDGEGRVYVSYRDANTFDAMLKYIDTENKSLGEDVPMPDISLDNVKLYMGEGYDIYYNDGTAIYGCNEAEGDLPSEPVKLLDFVNSDLVENSVRDILIIDSETFLASYYEYSADKTIRELYLLSHIPDDEVPERYVIRLGVNYDNYDITNQVVRFNRSSDKYRVVVTQYSNYNTEDNYSLAEETLAGEFTAGTAPDLVMLSEFGNREQLLESGVFLDLYTLMDADPEFDRAMFFSSVLQPMERKGELNELVTVLSLRSIAGKSANIPYKRWTADDFLDYAEKLPEGKYLFDYTNNLQMLNTLLCMTLDEFVDTENGSVNFDTSTFRRMLQYAKNTDEYNYLKGLSGDALADYQNDRNRVYREDSVLLNECFIYSVGDVVDTMFTFGFEDTVFVGYPTENGNGAVLEPTTSYAVNKDSPVSVGAWEFIKTTFKDESRYGRNRISSIIENFRKNAEMEMEMHYFYRYDGGTSGSTGDDFLNRYSESEGIYRDTTEADVKLAEELINGAAPIPSYAVAIVEIILEDLEMYFDGSKSLDETVKIINSRIGTYISENY